MKIYATFPNLKKRVIEEQLIETENYTRDELKEIIYSEIYFNNCEIDADTLDEYKIKISCYVNDYARNNFSDVLTEQELIEIMDAVEQELIEITESVWEEKEWEEQ